MAAFWIKIKKKKRVCRREVAALLGKTTGFQLAGRV